MKIKKSKLGVTRRQAGFGIVEIVFVIVVVSLLGLITFLYLHGRKTPAAPLTQAQIKQEEIKKANAVIWKYNDAKKEYEVSEGRAPKCPKPFKFENSPADLTSVTGILAPGQYRSFDYKPHGGFRFDNSADGKMEIKMPADATLTALTGYLEGDANEIQYVMQFETDCGIAFRFDHIYDLSPELQAIAATRPAPQKDDTRSDPNNPPERTLFKAGTVIASAIGHASTRNFAFDFGVYDYRSTNKITDNSVWKGLHDSHPSQDWYGRCWFDMLPEPDAGKVKELSLVPINSSKPIMVSDYCENFPHTTLEFNGGLPTQGN